MADDTKDAEAKKRSEAAKKAAETRKANEQSAQPSQPRGGRKVGKNQGGQGPRGGRKVGKTADAEESGPRGGRKVGKTGQDAEGLSEYQPKRQPLQAAGLDQHAAEAERQAERDAEREEHNRRTGDASLPRGGRKVG